MKNENEFRELIEKLYDEASVEGTVMTKWERDFIFSIHTQLNEGRNPFITEKQEVVVYRIEGKVFG